MGSEFHTLSHMPNICNRFLYEINEYQDLEDLLMVEEEILDTLDDGTLRPDLLAPFYSQAASMLKSIGKVDKAIEYAKLGST